MDYFIMGAVLVVLAVLVQGVIAECEQGDASPLEGGD